MSNDDDELIGEIVWAGVSNAVENRSSQRAKLRPVVRVDTTGGAWRCVGLTTQAVAADGRERPAIPNWEGCGLAGPGWLWGDRFVAVSRLDFGDHIGWIDLAFAAVILSHVPMTYEQARGLWRAACDVEDIDVTDPQWSAMPKPLSRETSHP